MRLTWALALFCVVSAPRSSGIPSTAGAGYLPDFLQNLFALNNDVDVGTSLEEHVREKRKVAGTTPADTNITLTSVSGSTSAVFGDSLDYTITIILPSGSMNVSVEIFTSDADTGAVAFHLSDVKVVTSATAITPAVTGITPVYYVNSYFDWVYDHVILNFGTLTNADTDTTNYALSTFTVSFKATAVLANSSLTSSKILAGMDYGASNYVWVAEDTITISLTETYNPNVILTGTNVWTDGNTAFTLTAYMIRAPPNLRLQIYSPNITADLLDKFTLSYVGRSLGSGFACSVGPDSRTTYTVTRSPSTASVMLSELYEINLINCGTENISDVNNAVTFTFSLSVMPGTPPNTTIPLSAALNMNNVKTIYIGAITAVTPELTTPGPGTVASLVMNTPVSPIPDGGTVYIDTQIEVTAGALDFQCTVTPSEAATLALGVQYMRCGSNIAQFNALTSPDYITYSGNTMTFRLKLVHAAVATDSIQSKVYLLVAVTDEEGTPPSNGQSFTVSISCASLTSQTTVNILDSVLSTVAPNASLKYAVGTTSTQWPVSGQVSLDLTFNVPPNAVMSKMQAEFMSQANFTAYDIRICRVEFSFIGRNLITLQSQKGTLEMNASQLLTTPNRSFVDYWVLPIGSVSAPLSPVITVNATDYYATLNMVAELPLQDPSKNISGIYTLQSGIRLSSSIIFGGQANFTVASNYIPIAVSKAVLLVVAPTTPILPARMFEADLYLKIKPQTHGRFRLRVSAPAAQPVTVCTLRIKDAGRNFPCLDRSPEGKWGPTQSTRISSTRQSTASGKVMNQEVLLELGIVSNVGTYTSNPAVVAMDESTILVSVLGQLTELSQNAAVTQAVLNVTMEDVSSSIIVSSQNLIVPVNGSAAVTAGNFTGVTATFLDYYDPFTGYYPMVSKVIVAHILIPPGHNYLKLSALFEVVTPGVEVCQAHLVKVGSNIPCLNGTINDEYQPAYNLGAKVGVSAFLGSVCTGTGLANDTYMDVAVSFIVPSNLGPVELKVSLVDNAGSPTAINTMTVSPTAATPNETYVLGSNVTVTGNGSTITLNPGRIATFGFSMSVPMGAYIQFNPVIQTPSLGGRAQMTVNAVRVLNAGTNLLCLKAQNRFSSGLSQSENITSNFSSQTDLAKVQFGMVRDTGLTGVLGIPSATDDIVQMEVDVELTDHPANLNGITLLVYLGINYPDVIVVGFQQFVVSRTGNERPDIDVNLFLISPAQAMPFPRNYDVDLRATVAHTNMSSREANNARVRIVLPPYVTPETASISTNKTIAWVNATDVLDIVFDRILFSDVIDMNVTVKVNPNDMMTPRGTSTGLNATTLIRLICNMDPLPGTAIGSAKWPSASTDFYYCGKTDYVNYAIVDNVCNAAPLGMQSLEIQDCQLGASSAYDDASAPKFARMGQTSGVWSPGIVPGDEYRPYLQVNFGNYTQVTSIMIEKPMTSYRTIESFTLQRSIDTVTFLFHESGSFSASGVYNLTDPLFGRAMRLVIESASDPAQNETKHIGVRAEFYGCTLSADVADHCAFPAPPTRMTNDSGQWRHFAVDTVRDLVYFCDYNPKTDDMSCFSGDPNSNTWTALPPYISQIAGFDRTHMYILAHDKYQRAYLSSEDGVKWMVIDKTEYQTAIASATFQQSVAVPGNPSGATSVAFPNSAWTADFSGLMRLNVRVVDWSNCCR